MEISPLRDLKILIIEDMPDNAELLISILKESRTLKNPSIHHYTHLVAAEAHLIDRKTDLVFLDLDLNGQDGFQILENLSQYSFRTIIVSAFTEKALQAFDYGVLDFVPKPAEPGRVEKALIKFSQGFFRLEGDATFSVPISGGQKFIKCCDIEFIESDAHKSLVHTLKGDVIQSNRNIRYFEETLPLEFFRVQKSFIVNLNSVKGITSAAGGTHTITLVSGNQTPVSRNLIEQVKAKLAGQP